MRTHARSPYIQFSKLQSSSDFNLATSAMASYPLSGLDLSIEQLEINGNNPYGYMPLREAIAQRYQVPVESVVTATGGTSMANYLALAAIAEPGEEVLVESPTYELLLSAAQFLGLKVRRFGRRVEGDFSIDLEDLAHNLTPETRAIVLCNLHNPTGHFTDDGTLAAIGRMARKVGARVLVDEVYRDMVWEQAAKSAVQLDPEVFVSTNSLTKTYGLGGLRCGWVLATPELAERMWYINDLHGLTSVYPSEVMALAAFERLNLIAEKQRALLDTNRALLKQFIESRSDLDCYWPEYGTIIFPKVRNGRSTEFPQFFREQFQGTVVPGEFFEVPERFRVGVGLPTEQIERSLAQLGKALDAFGRVS
jgi:aspartate/methionine/tyrosine aminotransferase